VTAIDAIINPVELAFAAYVGVSRNIQALRECKGDRLDTDISNAWTLHIEGAAGEMAAAKALGLYWDAPVGTYKHGGDIGALQVRTRSRHSYELIVRDGDRSEDIFVLVTGRAPRFRVHGWIAGGDAKRPEWLREYGGRPAAYFVPHDALQPLTALSERNP
jgi:hypothetical protein